MSVHNTGGPAFPELWENDSGQSATTPDGQIVPPYCKAHLPGMTLRDYFAAKAIPGLLDVCRDDAHPGVSYLRHIAQLGNQMADEMLEVRNG